MRRGIRRTLDAMRACLRAAALVLALVTLPLACGSAPSTPPAGAPSPSIAPSLTAEPAGATAYLDQEASWWIHDPPQTHSNVGCALSCHTTHPFFLVRASLRPSEGAALALVRAEVEKRVLGVDAWTSAVPIYGHAGDKVAAASLGTEAVLNASAIAFDDARRGRLSPAGERAFSHLWSVQRADGAWDWFDFGLEPWDEGLPTMAAAFAALAVGAAPAEYRERADVKPRVERLEAFVSRSIHSEGGMRLHEKALTLWASSRLPGLVRDDDRDSLAQAVEAVQRQDGSYSLATLVSQAGPSDGGAYATALAVLSLCAARPQSRAIPRGLAWLRAHRGKDGSWADRSINVDAELNHRLMSDAATAYASLALDACARAK
jgi:squalene-hopene/tetraprenyl-beta-curcumene cyclase